jgi:hypothetical protein
MTNTGCDPANGPHKQPSNPSGRVQEADLRPQDDAASQSRVRDRGRSSDGLPVTLEGVVYAGRDSAVLVALARYERDGGAQLAALSRMLMSLDDGPCGD